MKKPILILIVLLGVSMITLMLGLMYGSKSLAWHDVLNYLFDFSKQNNQSSSYISLVLDNRLPRTLAAFLCGAALGLSGALMQGLTRNPLGDSGLLGINTGASASIVLMAFFPALTAISSYWLAIVGALITALFVCLLGLGNQENHSRLILAGASISACLGAFVNAVSQLNVRTFDYLRFWASGSFGGISLQDIGQFLPFFIPFAILGIVLGKFVNIIALNKNIAQSLGANIVFIQGLVLVSAAVLAASSVAMAGPIGFIGLGAAHLARKWTGNDYRILLPASLLMGAILLLLSDILARVILAPSEIATGIMTAILGAPLLYYMVVSQTKGKA